MGGQILGVELGAGVSDGVGTEALVLVTEGLVWVTKGRVMAAV